MLQSNMPCLLTLSIYNTEKYFPKPITSEYQSYKDTIQSKVSPVISLQNKKVFLNLHHHLCILP